MRQLQRGILSWLNDFSADHFAHVVHSEPNSSDMEQDLQLTFSRKAGMVYVTHDVLSNPFDELPTYWNAEVVAAVPEPSAFVFCGVCVVLGFALKLKKQESD